ncbi:hypothetical protein BTN49_2105 [Candidatus Enterovibrio escicola]|uniref:Mobile element protein n=1 Tax=Candidatus Enterovibrio escicola TaxID=1927127 RepID=A0A2A5T2K1_9GAMM|nr:hypothetical protein BTN49_2105 [Candidatus Enterovibrio escacola]
MSTHEVIAAEVNLVLVGDNEVLPILLNTLRRNNSKSVLMEPMTQKHVSPL